MVLFTEIHEHRNRESISATNMGLTNFVDKERGQTVGVAKGIRLEKNAVNDAEDYGGGSDPQRKSDNGQRSKAEIFAEPPQREAEIHQQPAQITHRPLNPE